MLSTLILEQVLLNYVCNTALFWMRSFRIMGFLSSLFFAASFATLKLWWDRRRKNKNRPDKDYE